MLHNKRKPNGSQNLKGDYQKALALMFYKFFDNKSNVSGIKNEAKQNQQLANEVHKTIIWKF